MFKLFNFLKKKKGQSLVEYSIIVTLVIIASFAGTSKLYDAARHNFYYTVLPTNTSNIDLPKGPNGENGWYNDDNIGKAKIECSANTITTPTPIFDDNGDEVLVYETDQDQEIFCTDVSINGSRNSWGSKYKTIKLNGNGEQKVELTVWDDYGIKHSTYVIIKPKGRSIASRADVPIAIITTQPETLNMTFLDTDIVNVFGTNSTPLQGYSIEQYQWQIVDVGTIKGKRVSETYDLEKSLSSLDVRISDGEGFGIQERKESNIKTDSTIYFGASPTATRYIRLRVKSGGKWSDWTQKAIKTSGAEKPIARISTYSGVDMGRSASEEERSKLNQSNVSVRTGEVLFLTYVNSENPDTKDEPKLSISLENKEYVTNKTDFQVDRGLIAYKWDLFKYNEDKNKFESCNELAESESISMKETQYTDHVENEENKIYGLSFKEPGKYCVTLRVRNSDGNWSEENECSTDFSVPDSPNESSVKYFSVKFGNLPPSVTLTSSPPMVDGQIKGTIATEFIFTPKVVHPETGKKNYKDLYEPSDYQFGEYEWILYDKNDKEKANSKGSDFGDIKVGPLITSGTYYIKIRVSDKSGAWSEFQTFPITIIFPKNYGQPVLEDYEEKDLPKIPAGKGTLVNLDTDDVFEEIDMGFEFLAYGIKFSKIAFSSNGLLTFTYGCESDDGINWGPLKQISKGSTTYNAKHLSVSTQTNDRAAPDYSLAAYWTDLYPYQSKGTEVRYYVENDRVIIEYKKHSHFKIKNFSNNISFTIVIYSSGYIDVYYPDVDFDNNNNQFGFGRGIPNDSYQAVTLGIKGKSNQVSEFSYSPTEKVINNGQVLRYKPE